MSYQTDPVPAELETINGKLVLVIPERLAYDIAQLEEEIGVENIEYSVVYNSYDNHSSIELIIEIKWIRISDF